MPPEGWQDALLDDLRTLLEPNPDVLALVLFGSHASPELRDRFSDIDLLLTVREGAQSRFFPATDWLDPIGHVFAVERSTRERHGVLRICLDDFRRLDVVIVEEPTIADIEHWRDHPLRSPRHVIFSRSPAVDRAVRDVFDPVGTRPLDDAGFERMVNNFWFAAQLAAHKAVRGDLLIALHLQLEMLQDCCVLAMLVRDRAAGTRYHRHGGAGNDFVARLEAARRPHTAAGIIDAIEQAALAFDGLAREWSPSYQPRSPRFAAYLAQARTAAG